MRPRSFARCPGAGRGAGLARNNLAVAGDLSMSANRPHAPPLLTRRRLVAGAAALAVSLVRLPRDRPQAQTGASERSADGFRVLRARAGRAALRGPGQPETAIWGYDGIVPGPLLRASQGDELRVRLVNELPQPTLIHWHGIRLPNAMDGVPHLTQPVIDSGASFDYRFKVPDAGTFWYHTHHYSSEQLARGLYGPLIVEERTPPEVDQDVLLVLDDWRLDTDGAIHEASLGAMHDAAHAGRIGQHLTANSRPSVEIAVATNERLRLRLINAANARVMPLRIADHTPYVMAIDGQPAEPFLARASQITLGPGNRADLFIDAAREPGATGSILINDYGRLEVEIARLVYDPQAGKRPAPLAAPRPLPSNPLPERMGFTDALRIDIPIEGGAMSTMMMRRGPAGDIPGHGLDPRARLWTMAGLSSSGHDGPPLFRVRRGRTVVIAIANRTVFPHAMHLHGHHFRLLDNLDDGWKPFWLDTVVVAAEQSTRIAFVADNPGKWMIHCHMLEHQDTGMAAWFEVG